MKYRSKATVEAYHWDGTPEALADIIKAVPGAELITDGLGEPQLLMPIPFGMHKLKVGWWIYRAWGSWSIVTDVSFRNSYEVVAEKKRAEQS